MGLTFEQLSASGEEVDQFIIDCVIEKSLFKPDIISIVAFSFFIKHDELAMYNSSAERVVKEFVSGRFNELRKAGKLKFNKKGSKWVVVLNAGFPTLRSDYTCG